jgi:hypothetical protein
MVGKAWLDMSRKLATTIKDSAIPGKYKRVLEAYAAYANNDGTNIRPSQRQLAGKAGTSPDTIQRNTPDLIASGILRRAASHTCKVAACNKGGTHFTGTWGRWTIVYNLDISLLQNAVNYLTTICGKVNAAKCRKVKTAKCGTTQALKNNSAPLGTENNSSALTSGKEVTKEPLLALLVAECSAASPTEKTDTNPTELPSEEPPEFGSEEPEENQNQDTSHFHPSVWSLERMWKERTGYLFTEADKALAHKLIITYRYRVVEAVLRNTLWMRPKSAKLRWNKFRIFAKHWQRNHEEYLAWCARAHLDKKYGSSQSAALKFDPVPEEGWADANAKEFNALRAWFKENGKIGEWTVAAKDFGLRDEHSYVVLKYLGDEGLALNKEAFVDLLLEAGGAKDVSNCLCGKGCKGFCPLEVAMEVAE